jgi:hypothetical protein
MNGNSLSKSLRTHTAVAFDPTNEEHLFALAMLMQPVPRQHPTLRFHYDTTTHGSAVSAAKDAVIKAFVPPDLWELAEKVANDPEAWTKFAKRMAAKKPIRRTTDKKALPQQPPAEVQPPLALPAPDEQKQHQVVQMKARRSK